MSKWQAVAEAIARTDNSVRGAKAIIDYIKRPDDWSKASPPLQDTIITKKLNALAALGLMRGNALAIETVRKALRSEGIVELTQAWLRDELPGHWRDDHEKVIAYGRKRAAMGIVYADDSAGIAYLREEHAKVHELICTGIGQIQYTNMTEEQKKVYHRYTGLVSALNLVRTCSNP